MHKLEVFQRIQRSRINLGKLLHVVLQRVARLEEFSSASKVMFIGRKEIPFIVSNIFLFFQHPFLLGWCFKTPSSSFVWCKHETIQVLCMCFILYLVKMFLPQDSIQYFYYHLFSSKNETKLFWKYLWVSWRLEKGAFKERLWKSWNGNTVEVHALLPEKTPNLTMLEISGTVQRSSGSTSKANAIDSGLKPIVQNY